MNYSTTLDAEMGERATVTIHTTPENKARLTRLANETRRSKSFLGNEAIERYLAVEEEFIAGVKEGIADADAGRTVSSSELKQHLRGVIDREANRQA